MRIPASVIIPTDRNRPPRRSIINLVSSNISPRAVFPQDPAFTPCRRTTRRDSNAIGDPWGPSPIGRGAEEKCRCLALKFAPAGVPSSSSSISWIPG